MLLLSDIDSMTVLLSLACCLLVVMSLLWIGVTIEQWCLWCSQKQKIHDRLLPVPCSIEFRCFTCEKNCNRNLAKFLFLERFCWHLASDDVSYFADFSVTKPVKQIVRRILYTTGIWGVWPASVSKFVFSCIHSSNGQMNQINQFLGFLRKSIKIQATFAEKAERKPGEISNHSFVLILHLSIHLRITIQILNNGKDPESIRSLQGGDS